MATLPGPLGYGQGPRPPSGVASYSVTSSNAGQILEHAGGEVERATQIIAETNRKQDEITAQDAVNKLKQQALLLEQDPDKGFGAAKGRAVVGGQFVTGYQAQFDTAAQSISSSLTSEYQKRIFQAHKDVVGLQYQSALLQHQSRETDRFNKQTREDTISTSVNDILAHPYDEAVRGTNMLAVDAAITASGKDLGLAGEDLSKYVQDKRSGIEKHLKKELDNVAYESGALMFEQGQDPRKSPVWQRMDDGHKAVLLGRIRAEQDRKQALALAQRDHAERVAEKALDGARDFASAGGLMDRQYEDSVRSAAAAAGPAYKARAEALIKMSQQAAGYGSAPLQQQQATLRDLEAKAQTEGSSAEAMKRIQFLRGITDKQEKEYKENPWAASQRFGRLGVQAPVVNITAVEQGPALVAERVKQIAAVETMAGGPVSPLQPDEAAAMVDQMRKADPAAQSRALAGMAAPLGLGQIEALANQLGKGSRPMALAMKLGSLNTNAGRLVSELVLRGAAGLADKTIKKDDSALTGWRAEISAKVRGTLGSDQAEKDVIDAAYYVRAAQEQEGIALPGFSKGIGSGEDDAIAMVIGQPVVRAGVKTILPRGMTESDFSDRLQTQAPAQVAALMPSGKVYLRGREIDFKTGVLPLIGSMGLQRDERGRYIPINRGAMVTLDPGGTIPLAIQVQ